MGVGPIPPNDAYSAAESNSRYVPKTDTQAAGTPTRVFDVTIPGADATKASVLLFDVDFNTVKDGVLSVGFNRDSSGLKDTAYPGASWNLENDYHDGTARRMEGYLEFLGAGNTGQRRPFFAQYDRTTKELTSTIIAAAGTASGVINFQDAAGTRNHMLVGGSGTASETILKLGYGATNGAFQMRTFSASQLRCSINGGADLIGFFGNPAGGQAAASFSVGVIDNSAVGVFDVAQADPSVKGMVVRGRTSQTGNMFEVQDSGSTPRIKITKATTTVAPSLVIGSAALATSATDGFVYLPTCAGTPTGVPTPNTGTCAMVYDTTNNKIAIYNGAWKQTAALA